MKLTRAVLPLLILSPLAVGIREDPGTATGVHAATALARRPRDADSWSAKVTWRTRIDGQVWYPSPIHATLLPNGDVLFMGWTHITADPNLGGDRTTAVFTMTPTPLGQALPAHADVEAMGVPLDVPVPAPAPWFVGDDLTCSGHTLTSDGKFFVAGGSRTSGIFPATYAILGLPYALTYDGVAWTRVPANMQGSGPLGPERWYPACTTLADSRILVTGGFDMAFPQFSANLSTERYDPATGAWEVLSAHGATPPEIGTENYTHVFQLPAPIGTFDVLMFGQAGVPVLMATSGPQRWNVRGSIRPRTRPGEAPSHGASTSLLPIRVRDGEWGYRNGSVLIAGGAHGTSHEHHADIYDPIADSWQARNLSIRRHHPGTVLLPDGRILVISGFNYDGNRGVGRAQYVDPARAFAVSRGTTAQDEVRGYHNIVLLLPDGRVLVGGGNDDGQPLKEKPDFRYFHPPYMSAPRPRILDAPASVRYNAGFAVTWRGDGLSEVVLVALGSMTHSVDMNQRHVQLRVPYTRARKAWVIGPPDPQTAPPGYYMLFVLDQHRTPSIARIVRLH